MANPFSITPAGGSIGQGLAGLGQIVANRRAEEQQREDRMNMMQAGKVGTMQRYDLGDRIEIRDTRTGQLIETIPKGVSPQVQQQQDIRAQQFEQVQELGQQKLAAQTAATQESAAFRQQEATAKGEERALKAEETKAKIEGRKIAKQEAKQAKIDKGRDAIISLDRVSETVDQLINHPGRESAMGLSSALYSRPGGEAKNFEVILEQLTSQQFMNGVEQMKGLGSLTGPEGARIVNAVQALELEMSEEAGLKEFNKIKNTLKVAKARELKKYKAAGGDPAADIAEAEAAISPPPADVVTESIGAPPVGDVQGGYEFIGGDPSDQASWRKL